MDDSDIIILSGLLLNDGSITSIVLFAKGNRKVVFEIVQLYSNCFVFLRFYVAISKTSKIQATGTWCNLRGSRGALKVFLENEIRYAIPYTDHATRKTANAMEVVRAFLL